MVGGEVVVVCRHARTALNAAVRLRGHLDVPLDEVGVAEAARLGDHLAGAGVARVVTSPLGRAVQTAQAIATATRAPLRVDRRLIDRDYGDWAGAVTADVVARFGSLDDAPGVEASSDVLARASHALDDHADRGRPGVVVLVSHDAVIRTLLAGLDASLGHADAIPQRTACWNLLRHVDDMWRVEQVDQLGPLRPLQ